MGPAVLFLLASLERSHPLNAHEFLTAELHHAERQLARLRRIASCMEDGLTAQGLDEVAVYEKLAVSQAYRQLQRDQVTYQQVWLRVHRHLSRLASPAEPPQPAGIPIGELMASLRPSPSAHQPYRKPPTPGPNQRCLCGSNIKYKKCCGNPLARDAALNAA